MISGKKLSMLASFFLIAIMISSASAQSVFAQTPSPKVTSAANSDNGISGPKHTPAPGTILAKASTPTNINNGKWNEFSFFKKIDSTLGCFSADPSGPSCTPSSGANSDPAGAPTWDFTVIPNAHATLTVTDAFHAGDNFDVYDGGLIGTTPGVATDKTVTTSDPAVTSGSATWSHGSFVLASGPHTITAKTVKDSIDPAGGAAYFKVDLACNEGYEQQGPFDDFICVSTHINQLVGGMGIPIDTTALLLAGMQGSGLWMIPAIVVAGAGIAIFKIKKNKGETS
jgi:hypothetical protein